MKTTENWTVIKCPSCQSTQFTIGKKGRCRCSDCETIFDVPQLSSPAKRISEPGVRHRRNNGPAAYEVTPAEPPKPQDLGSASMWTLEIIQGGPQAAIAAHRKAAKLAKRFGTDFEKEWCLMSAWLRELSLTHRGRAQVRYALQWRPPFLAMKALTRSTILGAKAAGISPQTAESHRKQDKEFDAQCVAAEEYAVQLLHDVTFRRALEGDCKPIFWQGVIVGYERQYDGRLQIEMLRAHMPAKFKTPGAQQPLVSGHGNQIMVVDPATLAHIQGARAEALEEMRLAQATEIPLLSDVVSS